MTGQQATGARGRRWRRLGPGIYETTDGRFRVQNPYRQECKRPVWQLLETDGAGGWNWWQTYPTKGDAQANTPTPVPERGIERGPGQ